MNCLPDETGRKCVRCGWEWNGQGGFPRRNCPKAPSRGLGDTIAKVTKVVGIKPCGGCRKRQKKLNEMFPYRRPREK